MTVVVELKPDQITVYLVGTILLSEFLGICQGIVLHLFQVCIPESHEVFWFLSIRLDLLRRESHLDMMPILFAIHRNTQTKIPKTGLLTCADIDFSPSVLQEHFTSCVIIQHIISNGVADFRVTRYSIFIKLDFDGGILPCLIHPVSMVGNRDPQIITTIRIILCMNQSKTKQDTDNGRHPPKR